MLNVEKAANEIDLTEELVQITMYNSDDKSPLLAVVQTLLSIPMIRIFFTNFKHHPQFPILSEISSVLTKALRQTKINLEPKIDLKDLQKIMESLVNPNDYFLEILSEI
jgi:hypothetical protein